jgi:hypothetical protein
MVTYETPAGRDDVRNYLDGMQKPDRSKMLALLHRAADEGPSFKIPERCRALKGESFNEFKTHGHRILWMPHAGAIILMTAFDEKQGRTPELELVRGRNARAAVLSETGGETDGR